MEFLDFEATNASTRSKSVSLQINSEHDVPIHSELNSGFHEGVRTLCKPVNYTNYAFLVLVLSDVLKESVVIVSRWILSLAINIFAQDFNVAIESNLTLIDELERVNFVLCVLEVVNALAAFNSFKNAELVLFVFFKASENLHIVLGVNFW